MAERAYCWAFPDEPYGKGPMPAKVLNHISSSALIGGVAGSLALLIYLLTLAPDLTLSNFGSDGGELITAAVTLGIPHPPGYPTYVLMGKLFSLLPVGTIAWRFNFFSAVAAATAAGFVSATSHEALRSNKSVWPAALATG